MVFGFLLPAGALILAMVLLLTANLVWRIVGGVLIGLVAVGLVVKWSVEAMARREMADLVGTDPAADAWPPEPASVGNPPPAEALPPALTPTVAQVDEARAFSKGGD